MPEDGYGWEKLFSERMCRHFEEDFGLSLPCRPVPQRVRTARHVGRGPREGAGGSLPQGDRGKALGQHEIEIWGDGEQTRSFTYIDDCVYGTTAIMDSDIDVPINLGSDEFVSINQLVDIVEEIAGIRVERRTTSTHRKGVRGRNSDNTLIERELGWEPVDPPPGRAREDLRLDLRPDRRTGTFARLSSGPRDEEPCASSSTTTQAIPSRSS